MTFEARLNQPSSSEAAERSRGSSLGCEDSNGGAVVVVAGLGAFRELVMENEFPVYGCRGGPFVALLQLNCVLGVHRDVEFGERRVVRGEL